MKAFRKYFIYLFLHFVPSILILCFACEILSANKYTTEGLVKCMFAGNLDLIHRGLPGSISQSIPESIPQDIPNAISQIGSKATNVGNIVPSQVKSAIGSVETQIIQGIKSIPKGYSIGTKSACIIYSSHTECQNLPIKLNNEFEDIANLLPPLKALNIYLAKTPSLEVILILGLAFHLVSVLTYIFVYKFPIIRFVSAGLSILSAALIAVFVGFAWTIFDLAAKLKQTGTLHRRELYYGLIGSSMDILIAFACVFIKF